jgi:hypothetical protein
MGNRKSDLDREIERAAREQGMDSADRREERERERKADRESEEEMRAIEDEQAEIARDRNLDARVRRLAGRMLERGKRRVH